MSKKKEEETKKRKADGRKHERLVATGEDSDVAGVGSEKGALVVYASSDVRLEEEYEEEAY